MSRRTTSPYLDLLRSVILKAGKPHLPHLKCSSCPWKRALSRIHRLLTAYTGKWHPRLPLLESRDHYSMSRQGFQKSLVVVFWETCNPMVQLFRETLQAVGFQFVCKPWTSYGNSSEELGLYGVALRQFRVLAVQTFWNLERSSILLRGVSASWTGTRPGSWISERTK